MFSNLAHWWPSTPPKEPIKRKLGRLHILRSREKAINDQITKDHEEIAAAFDYSEMEARVLAASNLASEAAEVA
ncbi:MAG: hypothetical protein JKY23_06645, partial [Nitrospinaceae bacterium]|nr:hypothetical protein [Nitrospinaceae bacterium]